MWRTGISAIGDPSLGHVHPFVHGAVCSARQASYALSHSTPKGRGEREDALRASRGRSLCGHSHIHAVYVDHIWTILAEFGPKSVKFCHQSSPRQVAGDVIITLLLFLFCLVAILPGIRSDLPRSRMRALMQRYLLCKTVTSALIALAVMLSLWLMDVNLVFIFGMVTFLCNFIPNVGSFFAIVAPAPLVYLTPGKTVEDVVIAVVVPFLIHNTLGCIVEPQLMQASRRKGGQASGQPSFRSSWIILCGSNHLWAVPNDIPLVGVQVHGSRSTAAPHQSNSNRPSKRPVAHTRPAPPHRAGLLAMSTHPRRPVDTSVCVALVAVRCRRCGLVQRSAQALGAELLDDTGVGAGS